MSQPPIDITYHRSTRTLVLAYSDGSNRDLPAELLRVYSPSAEVRGHSTGERKLQSGKKHVRILNLEAVGNYALRIHFDDGHDSGLYTWELLADLADHADQYWRDYLKELKAANASRLPAINVGTWQPKK